jgi:hypothetical protein
MNAKVPPAYVGLWKRTLLRTPTVVDTASTVYWLQTPRWHSDIRIPASRNANVAVGSLAEADRSSLDALAGQQGFAGVTVVEDDLCRWQRRVDFQPPSGFNDIGRIQFETPDLMREYGVEQDYFEIWERVSGSTGASLALEKEGEIPVYLTVTGEFAMRVRPRRSRLGPASNLCAWLGSLDDDEARALVDFEISLAQRSRDGVWRVLYSTFPWLEGHSLADADVLDAAVAGTVELHARHWRVLE